MSEATGTLEFDAAASLRLHVAFGAIEDESNDFLDRSLSPRGPGMLYDMVQQFALPAGALASNSPAVTEVTPP